MRLLRLLLPLAAVLAAAAPASAAAPPIGVADNVFEPDSVAIVPGDTQQWRWVGQDMHDVVAFSGQTDSFRSKLHTGAGATFSHAFQHPGRFRYYCEVHFSDMRGTVQVGTPETVAPVLSSLSATHRARRTAKVLLRLDERSVVRLTLKRGSKTVKRVTKVLNAGRRAIRLNVRHLRAGRYAAQLQATDGWRNRSKRATARFRVVH